MRTEMDLPDDTLPDRPMKRFFVGFAVFGLVTFVAIALRSASLNDVVTDAVGAGVAFGLVGGILAAFGKKWLRRIVALASQIISNP